MGGNASESAWVNWNAVYNPEQRGPRTALRPCGWKTSFASTFMSEWPRPVCYSMVPTTGALQQCIGILPPVLVDLQMAVNLQRRYRRTWSLKLD
ncbi:hypothetical protein AV530_006035 [Patagioenas fasciata monilis]|uniref:Uncharacterized protein n=1 Tax=Patagioenas fasciata monilis TaxID=372326 RepID=A0A1V4J8G1_PATFA|nr:hypothetical protein AV530_006035 [Patagioenas fasciata monilis]